MKRKNERAIARVVMATGVSSVTTQLLTIREFLAQFYGNEFIIALIFFCWLFLGGIGTLLARLTTERFCRVTVERLGWLSLCLVCLSALQILGIRILRDIFFIHGSSVGFYPTLAYIFFLITPYALLTGFLLPYSFFLLRMNNPDYPGARIYITDNVGDVAGGVLFSFILVYLVTPLQAIFIAGLPLLAATFLLFHSFQGRHHFRFILLTGTALVILGAGIIIEPLSLVPGEGKRVYYCETRYGRIEVHQDKEQFTLFEDGIPLFSNQNLVVAEEAIHYPLSQTAKHENVLLISVESGMMAELKKYRPKAVDYVELNPEVTTVLFRFGMIKDILGLRVIHQDGRVYLRDSYKHYDAVIVNLPEPVTFQINRFYTDEFFALAKNRLAPRGVLSFSMEGFENYLSEPQRRKLSSLYNTVKDHFNHVLMLPGQKIFFLCSDRPIRTDIPACLAEKGIATRYISQYYYGNVTRERIRDLNDLTDPAAPKNIDIYPQLMRLMFSQWFAKFSTSPVGFVVALALLVFIYMIRITREEFLLFSTGCMTMGSEIIVIFAFQIFFGYIYSQIGMIVTFFLAGLLPGAWFGEQLSNWGRRVLIVTDMILIFLMGLFMLVLRHGWDRLPVSFFLVFGFVVSLVCGCQFPVAFKLRGGDNPAAVRSFSADLIGAACGTLFISVVLIPYFGISWAMAGLIGLKLASLFTIGIDYAKNKPTSVSLL